MNMLSKSNPQAYQSAYPQFQQLLQQEQALNQAKTNFMNSLKQTLSTKPVPAPAQVTPTPAPQPVAQPAPAPVPATPAPAPAVRPIVK
jgi:hypothetical protein